MLGNEIITESAAAELAKRLPSLDKHDYNALDQLVHKVASKHNITHQALHSLFKQKFNRSPKDWIEDKLSEDSLEDSDKLDIESEVNKLVAWASRKLNLKTPVKVELSYDTEEAQKNHRTGSHIAGTDTILVYAKNRNFIDIGRTILHELRHVQQDEQGKIKPNSSYPGSPIEADADKWAGAMIKVYGEHNHHIFQ